MNEELGFTIFGGKLDLRLVLFTRGFFVLFSPFIDVEVVLNGAVILYSITVEDIQEVGAYSYSMSVVVNVH